MLGDLFNQDILHRMPRGLNGRDLYPIDEARDYLAQHYTKLPAIPELARLVGTNQTKLKASFRRAIGLTLYDFVLKCRMDQAADLLLRGDHSVAQIAYRMGYDYPANFASAFKKYYGVLPRAWMQRCSRQGPPR